MLGINENEAPQVAVSQSRLCYPNTRYSTGHSRIGTETTASLIGMNASLRSFGSPSEGESIVGGCYDLGRICESSSTAGALDFIALSMEAITSDLNYWYRLDMQDAARILAVEASDILHTRLADRKEPDVLCSFDLADAMLRNSSRAMSCYA